MITSFAFLFAISPQQSIIQSVMLSCGNNRPALGNSSGFERLSLKTLLTSDFEPTNEVHCLLYVQSINSTYYFGRQLHFAHNLALSVTSIRVAPSSALIATLSSPHCFYWAIGDSSVIENAKREPVVEFQLLEGLADGSWRCSQSKHH